MNVPTTLQGWTLPVILDLMKSGRNEDGIFDFKEALPHSKAGDEKERLYSVCAAFANTAGGFLIFGIADKKRRLPPEERLVGIAKADEFMAHFNEYPHGCSPPITDLDHNAIPLDGLPARLIYVVEIRQSSRKPHAVGKWDEGVRFPVRTQGGTTAFMGLEDVRGAFVSSTAPTIAARRAVAALEALRDKVRDVQQFGFDCQSTGPTSMPHERDLELSFVPSPFDHSAVNPVLAELGLADQRVYVNLTRMIAGMTEVNAVLGRLQSELGEVGVVPDPPEGYTWQRQKWQEESDQLIARKVALRQRAGEALSTHMNTVSSSRSSALNALRRMARD